jgi:molybdopterin molybdotransferase
VKLITLNHLLGEELKMENGEWRAEPIFGKSNLIFTLAAADGLLRIPPDATGLSAGETVEVILM